VPTTRLAALAAAAAAVVLVAPAPAGVTLIAVNVVLLVVASVDLVRTTSPARVQVERGLPGVVALDGAAELSWTVRNPTARPVTVWLADQLPPSVGAASRRARLRVPASGRATQTVSLRPSRRGRFVIEGFTVRTAGPWGLAARQRRRDLPGEVRVYPPFHSRQEAELRINRARILEVGLRSARGRGGGTEFDQLREYGPDDEYRRIDWSATARLGKPLVRTYRAERNQTVIVLLDTGRTMAARVAGGAAGHVPRLDHALDALLAVTAVSTRLGDRAGLVAFADTVRAVVPPGHTRDQLARVAAAVYELEPVLAESDYRRAFTETLTRFRRRALLVVLTELAAQSVADTLLPALPMVARSHLTLVAAVRDPAVERWAAALPEDPAGAYRKAAAVAALDDRRQIASRLRGLGAVVVDEHPGRLAPALADAYLEVKAAGRL
jgi:uncharacterized protein (DUF58 family)